MKRFVYLTIIIVMCSASNLFAQVGDPKRNYDFEKPLYTVVDVATKGWFSGWSGDCNSGRAPVAITLVRMDANAKNLVIVPATLTFGARPDAAQWLAAVCNRPFDNNVGWSIVPNNPEPAGTFTYAIIVTDVPTSWGCGVYPAGYPNAGQMWCDFVANQVYRIVS